MTFDANLFLFLLPSPDHQMFEGAMSDISNITLAIQSWELAARLHWQIRMWTCEPIYHRPSAYVGTSERPGCQLAPGRGGTAALHVALTTLHSWREPWCTTTCSFSSFYISSVSLTPSQANTVSDQHRDGEQNNEKKSCNINMQFVKL